MLAKKMVVVSGGVKRRKTRKTRVEEKKMKIIHIKTWFQERNEREEIV